jgi:general secretion pathway protein D
MIDDGGIVVLGGLTEDNTTKGENRVPFLGSIPIIGYLFKTRNEQSTKNNLMIFIRPKILRDAAQAAFETDLKYNYMLEQEKQVDRQSREAIPMLPGVTRGSLPPLPPGGSAPAGRAPPANPTGAAAPSTAPAPGAPATPGTPAPDNPAASPADQPPPKP